MCRINAIYARQSVDRADSISIENQIGFCTYEARSEAYEVFADRGYSGKNTQRPEFQRMLRKIQEGKIHRVICYKLDRCSRSILDFTTLMAYFQSYDVEFVSCTEKFDTASPMGRAMLSICVVFAQLERETIQQRVYDAYHARCRQGFYMGGRIPLGYRLTKHTISGKHTACYEPEQKEAEILAMLYELYARPENSLADVVQCMEKRNIQNPKRADGLWVRSHIGRMLRNPIYVKAEEAIYEYYLRQKVAIENPVADFIGMNGCYLYTDRMAGTKLLVLAPHPGIVDSDLWLACRKKGYKKKTG